MVLLTGIHNKRPRSSTSRTMQRRISLVRIPIRSAIIDATAPYARRLRQALVDVGFGDLVPVASALTKPNKVFMLGQKPWRVDILTSIDGLTFKDVWTSRAAAEFVASPLHVIGRDMLIKNERAAGRPKDRAVDRSRNSDRRSDRIPMVGETDGV